MLNPKELGIIIDKAVELLEKSENNLKCNFYNKPDGMCRISDIGSHEKKTV